MATSRCWILSTVSTTTIPKLVSRGDPDMSEKKKRGLLYRVLFAFFLSQIVVILIYFQGINN